MNDLISRALVKHNRDLLLDQARKAMPCTGEDEELDHGARMYRAGIQDLARRLLALPAASQPEAGWCGMGGSIAPKFDPNCECVCHSQPGVMHVAPCCQPQPEAEPVAVSRGSVLMRDGRGYVDFATPAPVVPAEGLDALIGEIVFETVNSEIDRGLAGRIIAALRAQQPAAPVSGVTVQEAARVLLTRLQYSSEADFLDAMQQVMPTEQTADLYAGLTAALSALEGK